jgi:hypothetical protein
MTHWINTPHCGFTVLIMVVIYIVWDLLAFNPSNPKRVLVETFCWTKVLLLSCGWRVNEGGRVGLPSSLPRLPRLLARVNATHGASTCGVSVKSRCAALVTSALREGPEALCGMERAINAMIPSAI